MKVRYPQEGGREAPVSVSVPLPDRKGEAVEIIPQGKRVLMQLVGAVRTASGAAIVLDVETMTVTADAALIQSHVDNNGNQVYRDSEYNADPASLEEKARRDAGGGRPRGAAVVRKSEAELARSDAAEGEQYDARGKRIDETPVVKTTVEGEKPEAMSAREAQEKATQRSEEERQAALEAARVDASGVVIPTDAEARGANANTVQGARSSDDIGRRGEGETDPSRIDSDGDGVPNDLDNNPSASSAARRTRRR